MVDKADSPLISLNALVMLTMLKPSTWEVLVDTQMKSLRHEMATTVTLLLNCNRFNMHSMELALCSMMSKERSFLALKRTSSKESLYRNKLYSKKSFIRLVFAEVRWQQS